MLLRYRFFCSLTYRFNIIQIKVPASSFCRDLESDSEIYFKMQRKYKQKNYKKESYYQYLVLRLTVKQYGIREGQAHGSLKQKREAKNRPNRKSRLNFFSQWSKASSTKTRQSFQRIVLERLNMQENEPPHISHSEFRD